MRSYAWLVPALAALPLLVGVAGPGMAAPDPLAPHRWKDRVVLVLAEGPDDPRLQAQRQVLRNMGRAATDRDLVLVAVAGDTSEGQALRRRLGLPAGFHALLIGKDGGVKLAATAPLGPDALLPLIDAMPMRQEEMRRRS